MNNNLFNTNSLQDILRPKKGICWMSTTYPFHGIWTNKSSRSAVSKTVSVNHWNILHVHVPLHCIFSSGPLTLRQWQLNDGFIILKIDMTHKTGKNILLKYINNTSYIMIIESLVTIRPGINSSQVKCHRNWQNTMYTTIVLKYLSKENSIYTIYICMIPINSHGSILNCSWI